MVTPVHRFQQIDSVTSQPQSSRHIRPPPYNVCREPDTTRVEVDSSVYLESPSEPHHPRQNGKFRRLMCTFFSLFTFFIVASKFYFDHQSTGVEAAVVCLVVFLLVYAVLGCTMSVLKSKRDRAEAPSPPPPGTGIEILQILPPPAALTPPPTLDLDAPPPPYHIAVSLPHSVTPPPSYDKAIS